MRNRSPSVHRVRSVVPLRGTGGIIDASEVTRKFVMKNRNGKRVTSLRHRGLTQVTCRGMGLITPTQAITKHGVQTVRPESEGTTRYQTTLSCGKTCRKGRNKANTNREQGYFGGILKGTPGGDLFGRLGKY